MGDFYGQIRRISIGGGLVRSYLVNLRAIECLQKLVCSSVGRQERLGVACA